MEGKSNNDDLSGLVRDLVLYLKEIKKRNYGANSSVIFDRLAGKLEDLISHYDNDQQGLARVQIGIGKWFDFALLKEARLIFGEIGYKKVDNVVMLALHLMGNSKNVLLTPCGNHQDQACVICAMGKRFSLDPAKSVFQKKGWPDLPNRDAVCFINEPDNITLNSETRLFRIFDNYMSFDYGVWWMEAKPANRSIWRSKMAVMKEWNSDSYYKEIILASSLPVWKGKAASQQVPSKPCILPGGGDQVWLDTNMIADLIARAAVRSFP